MIRMSGITEERWQENPHELCLMALFYVAGFVALKYERRDKPTAKLRNAKLVYNAIMSVFSFYVFYGVCRALVENYYNSKSEANPLVCDNSLELFKGMEWYFKIFYYSKFVEYVDTFFLVMAGVANPGMKMTLHLYHHLVTPSIVYFTWFYPCNGGWCGPLTNSFVHVIMYAYYGISVVYPNIKKYGNIVTYVQLTQFVGVILYHAFLIIPNCWDCNCNRLQLAFNFSQYIIFLFLFFFFLTFKNRSKQVAPTTTSTNGKPIVKQE